jgi:hypothetical protein
VTIVQIVQLAAAAALFAGGVALYRRRDKADSYGSQSAVLMWAAAAILLILGSGALRYHPSEAELNSIQARSQ